MKKHYIVYSHGFGVEKDDRGLFNDIALAIPKAQHVMFDYNEVNRQDKTLTVNPLQEQVRRLTKQLEMIEDGTVDIVAHSQGCIVAALAKPQHVRRILCIAPPDSINEKRMLDVFGNRPGSHIDLEGESRVPRRDGTTTIIPAEYWRSINLDVLKLYNRFPDLVEKVELLVATNDEILGTTNFDATDQRIELVHVRGNHDFTGEYRAGLVRIAKDFLAE